MENLTDLFYGLIDDGYIYEEDENGLNMSYGEYAEIQDYFHTEIVRIISEEVGRDTTLAHVVEVYNELMTTADDDTRMFAGIGDDDTVAYAEYYRDNEYFETVLEALEDDGIEIDYEITEEE